jgi:FkbM family methyltransferase
MKEIALDLVEFIEKELKLFRLPNFSANKRKEQFAWRMYGFAAWRRGDISITECLRNLLPGGFKTTELQKKLQTSLDKEISGIFERANLLKRPTTLFKKEFHATTPGEYKNWLIALKLINEVVIEDEYVANRYVAKDSIVIDAGANIGVFSALAATLAPHGKIYAFEPAQSTFNVLKENIKSYTNVTAVQICLGDKVEQEAEFAIENSTGIGNSLVKSGLVKGDWEKVRTSVTTVDTIVRERNLTRIDFIKIDTEGYEIQILMGAAATIKKFHPTLSLSAYHHEATMKDEVEQLTNLIKSFCPDYQCVLKGSPMKDLICTVPKK